MAKHKSPGQLWIDELARRKESAKNGNSTNLDMDPDIRHAINEHLAKAGRGPITNREILQGHLNRSNDMSFEDAMRASAWKPIMPQTDVGPLAKEIAQAEEAVRNAQFRNLSKEEQALYNLKLTQQKLLQQKADKAAVGEWHAKPEVVQTLEKLNDLRNRAAFDPSWTYAETMKIEQAIEQINTVGSDLSAGLELTKAAFDIVEGKRQAVLQQFQSQRAELDAQIAELDVVLSPAEPPAMSSKDDPWWKTMDELHAAGDAHLKTRDDLIAKGVPVSAPERIAASQALKANNAAITAHRAARDQQQPAAADQGVAAQ